MYPADSSPCRAARDAHPCARWPAVLANTVCLIQNASQCYTDVSGPVLGNLSGLDTGRAPFVSPDVCCRVQAAISLDLESLIVLPPGGVSVCQAPL